MVWGLAAGYRAAVEHEWAVRMTEGIGRRIAFYRKSRRMTAQALAEKCATLGLPIGRPVITKIERGIRQHITVPELTVIAKALNVAPVQLAIPVGLEDKTEILPGKMAGSWDAALWFTGERDYPGPADLDAEGQAGGETPGQVMYLFRRHETYVLRWWHAYQDLAQIQKDPALVAKLVARDGIPRSEEGLRNQIEGAKRGLRRARQDIRAEGLAPPPLPPELASVDSDGED